MEGDLVQCRICKSKDTKVVAVLNGLIPHCQHTEYNLYGCNSCNTLFYNPFPLENYAEFLGKAGDKFEIEYGAGLLFMSSLIYPLREFDIKSMLEIGGGLFSLPISQKRKWVLRSVLA